MLKPEGLKMEESLTSPKTPAEFQAIVEDQLRQIGRMHERMDQNQAEIERLRAESAALRADTDRILARIDARLAAIQALL
jgi:peptidoglycan hydrolase CwlO-like protein